MIKNSKFKYNAKQHKTMMFAKDMEFTIKQCDKANC